MSANTQDRELLKMAAKAAGIEVIYYPEKQAFEYVHPFKYDSRFWNPLTDDAQALRLAVKLHIDLYINHAVRVDYRITGVPTVPLYEAIEPDPYAATRRAIVRAAAEIGRAMP